MNITIFSTITNKDKSNVVEKLITHSTPSQDFYLMIVLAIVMATLGLLLNNVAIIIGSMLISPILYSFLSLSLGLSISDPKLIGRSFFSIIKAMTAGIISSAIVVLFIGSPGDLTSEMVARINPSLAYGAVALIAGFVAAFAITKPQLSETLPGIAISVALIPPIAASGIGLGMLDWNIVRGSLLLFVLNAIAIISGSLFVFLFMNIYAKKSLAKEVLKNEEKEIKNEKNE